MAKIHTPIPALKLSDSTSMPMLAYGTGTAWYKTSAADEGNIDKALVKAIGTAIDLDYTHLDAAEVYRTEPELGEALKAAGKPRDSLYIVDKVIDNLEDIEGSLRASLKKLGLDRLDLYLIHAPFKLRSGGDTALQKAWAVMERCKDAGLTTSIGVSNYAVADLTAILATAKHPPVVNQIEFNPYLQQHDLLAFHKQHHIATVAYSPLAPVTKARDGPIDAFVAALAKKYAVSPAEILLRWCIDQDVVAVTTSGNEQRLSDYLRCATFKLTPKEIEEVGQLGQGKHFRGFWNSFFPDDPK